jgi:hypothetical protein
MQRQERQLSSFIKTDPVKIFHACENAADHSAFACDVCVRVLCEREAGILAPAFHRTSFPELFSSPLPHLTSGMRVILFLVLLAGVSCLPKKVIKVTMMADTDFAQINGGKRHKMIMEFRQFLNYVVGHFNPMLTDISLQLIDAPGDIVLHTPALDKLGVTDTIHDQFERVKLLVINRVTEGTLPTDGPLIIMCGSMAFRNERFSRTAGSACDPFSFSVVPALRNGTQWLRKETAYIVTQAILFQMGIRNDTADYHCSCDGECTQVPRCITETVNNVNLANVHRCIKGPELDMNKVVPVCGNFVPEGKAGGMREPCDCDPRADGCTECCSSCDEITPGCSGNIAPYPVGSPVITEAPKAPTSPATLPPSPSTTTTVSPAPGKDSPPSPPAEETSTTTEPTKAPGEEDQTTRPPKPSGQTSKKPTTAAPVNPKVTTKKPDEGSNLGLIIGVVVALIVVVAIALIAFLIYMSRRKSRRRRKLRISKDSGGPDMRSILSVDHRSEIDVHDGPARLPVAQPVQLSSFKKSPSLPASPMARPATPPKSSPPKSAAAATSTMKPKKVTPRPKNPPPPPKRGSSLRKASEVGEKTQFFQ